MGRGARRRTSTSSRVDGEHPVALRDGNLLAVAFHAELTDDTRLHALFMAMVTSAKEARSHA